MFFFAGSRGSSKPFRITFTSRTTRGTTRRLPPSTWTGEFLPHFSISNPQFYGPRSCRGVYVQNFNILNSFISLTPELKKTYKLNVYPKLSVENKSLKNINLLLVLYILIIKIFCKFTFTKPICQIILIDNKD